MEQKTDLTSFSPLTVSWLVAITVGIIMPLFIHDFIIAQLSLFSPTVSPDMGTVTSPTSSTLLLASLSLFLIAVVYISALGFQILTIAKLKKAFAIIPFVVTVLGPFFIWLTVPYLVAAITSGG